MSSDLSATVYIKDLPMGTTDEELREALSIYGSLVDVILPAGKNFGFAAFDEEHAAHSAAAAGVCTIGGSSCRVEMRTGSRRGAAPQVPEGTSTSLYLPDVSDHVTESAVEDALVGYGVTIKNVLFRNRVSGQRYAFVELASAEEVQQILKEGPSVSVGDETVAVEERRSVNRRRTRVRDRRPVGQRRADGDSHDGEEGGGAGGGGGRRRGVGGGKMSTPPKPENSVYIKGFPADTAEEEIRNAFAGYGAITSLIVRVKDFDSEIRTWAFVEYEDPGIVQDVLNDVANRGGMTLGGTNVTVEERKSTPRPFRSGGRGRGGGRRPGGGGGGRGEEGEGGGRRRTNRRRDHDDGGDHDE